jgi:hypothetical protein
MATSQLELIMAQVRPLSFPDELTLLQRVTEDLQLKAAATDTATAEVAVSYASFFGAGCGSFATPEAADTFLRQEREAWDD